MGLKGTFGRVKNVKDYRRYEVELENKETLAYKKIEGGEGTLILLHGNLSSSIWWDLLLEEFAGKMTIYAVDLRGFGDSSYFESIDSIKDFSEDLRLFRKAMGIEKCALSGWSLGGAVAMRHAIDHPQAVEKLVLLSTSAISGAPLRKRRFFGLWKTNTFLKTREEIEKGLQPLLDLLARGHHLSLKRFLNKHLFHRDKPHDRRYERYIEGLLKQRNHIDVAWALANFNISSRHNGIVEGSNEAKDIRQPVCIIHGTEDNVVPPVRAEEAKEEIGENATLHILPHVGHAPLVDDIRTVMGIYEHFLLD